MTAASGPSASGYGFTGEYQSADLVYLRARHYAPGTGRFLTRDTWPGQANRPLSLNRWGYVEGNPANLTDPSGKIPEYCKAMKSKIAYHDCILTTYHVRPIGNVYLATSTVTGSEGCFSGPIEYRAGGYLEGIGGFIMTWWGGSEIVYDFATMERQKFLYLGPGVNDSFLGGGISAYSGAVSGFRSDNNITRDYAGPFFSVTGGVGLDVGELGQFVGLGVGVSGFISWGDARLYGISWYIGGGLSVDLIPGLEAGMGIFLFYQPTSSPQSYVYNAPDGKKVNRGLLLQDIGSGSLSPWPFFIADTAVGQTSRMLAKLEALRYANIYEEIHNAK